MSGKTTLEIKYTCKLCGLIRTTVKVRSRDPHQDISDWMHTLTLTLAADHATKSPHCQPKTLSDVMIPYVDDVKLGTLPS